MPNPDQPILELPAVAHQGMPVLTTELLARSYGVEPKVIHDGFARNEGQFQEGLRFFKLVGDELRAFKSQPVFSGLADKFAPHLYLWTERGAARHAKMISSPKAWEVFDRLECAYFSQPAALRLPSLAASECTSVFRSFYDVATLIGFDKPHAALSANRAAQRMTGIDVLTEMGTPQLVSARQNRVVTPSDIGVELGGLSGMAVNKLLIGHGLQTETRDAKGRSVKKPTEKGQPFAVWVDTGKKQGDGAPVHQLKWSAEIIGVLLSARAMEPAL